MKVVRFNITKYLKIDSLLNKFFKNPLLAGVVFSSRKQLAIYNKLEKIVFLARFSPIVTVQYVNTGYWKPSQPLVLSDENALKSTHETQRFRLGDPFICLSTPLQPWKSNWFWISVTSCCILCKLVSIKNTIKFIFIIKEKKLIRFLTAIYPSKWEPFK